MTPFDKPGDVTPRVRALIVGACIVTIFATAKGMAALWGIVEWIEVSSWGVSDWGTGRTAWRYESGLALAVAAAIALAYLPRFDVSRLLRVAVLLPLIHLVAIVVAAKVWMVLEADLIAKLHTLHNDEAHRPAVTLPSLAVVAAAFAAMVAIGIAIKRRHGEAKHATVMLALSFLLLLGIWLPVLCKFSFQVSRSPHHWNFPDDVRRLISPTAFVWIALLPPAIVAVSFVTFAFRLPAALARNRVGIRQTAIGLLVLATVVALTLPDDGWDLYLESSYLVLTALILAVMALGWLTLTSAIGARLVTRRLRKLVHITGVIAHDDEGDAACVEITSWLRGPRIITRPFVVTTARGDVPVTGAQVCTKLSAATTTLGVGESMTALAAGDRVVIAGHRTNADGHPFRAADATDVAFVASPAARDRFSDVALVVWRPAVAYLAIVVAVALPYLSIVLTD